MIETGGLFDEMMEKARTGNLNFAEVYPPLAKAMKPGEILDPKTVPPEFSLKELIERSLYADNVLYATDAQEEVAWNMVACVLALNAHIFELHETFSNLTMNFLKSKGLLMNLEAISKYTLQCFRF